MNINFPAYNYNQNFQGSSRRLQCSIDKALLKKNLSKTEQDIFVKEISNALDTILIPPKFIEEGSHNAVYKITHKYAARVPLGYKPNDFNKNDLLKLGRGIFSKLRNYFGESVLEIGKLQILPNIGKHIPAGIPEHLMRFLSKNQINQYYINKYLPTFAKLPQDSYNSLIKDIEKLNEIKLGPHQYCLFDYLNPNNVVTRSGKLYLVDEIDTLQDKSYMNTTAKLLNVFINRASRNHEAPFAGKSTKFVRKIFKKVLIASANANMLPANSKEDIEIWQKALKKCNIKTNVFEIIENLENLSIKYPTNEERVNAGKIYLDKLFNKNPLKK